MHLRVMKDFFKELLEYTYAFNDKVIESLMQNSKGIEKSIQLINHTINAQQIWNARIENTKITITVWDIRSPEDLKTINLINYQKSLAIVDSFDLEKRVIYTNTKGEVFENSIRDILFHVVNHSTYHRGQIATDHKLNGIQPLVTDYIFYKREEI